MEALGDYDGPELAGFAKIEAERMAETKLLEEGRARLVRLEQAFFVSLLTRRSSWGTADYVETQLRERLDDHPLLLNQIPEVPDLQSACSPSTLRLSPCKLHVAGGPRVLKAMTEGCGHVCAGFLDSFNGRVGFAECHPCTRQPTGPIGPIVCSW